MAFKLGKDCKFYFISAPLAAVATGSEQWVLTGNVRDVAVDRSTGTADMTTRGNAGYRQRAATLKEATITFEMLKDGADAAFQAFQAAYDTSSEIAVAAMDGLMSPGAGNSSSGLTGNFTVSDFSESQELEESVKISVTLQASTHTNYLTVTGGGS
ncbi:MAG TPA: hypothetical protein VLL76_04050 [Candidatus Omnitrophota bacterium]|nr:hypothetical protein [Candidatus Omnitrophota bacterium]